MNTFEKLNKIDVSDHIEKKMNLSYLSWAWAHAEMKKIDEKADVTIHNFPHFVQIGDTVQTVNKPYLSDKGGAWVNVSVTINERTETEWLPVMDMRNKALPEPDAMSINKAHKRCFVKALALHGLGLYIYAGEDLPAKEPAKKVSETQAKALDKLITVVAKEADKTPAQMKALIFKHKGLQCSTKDINDDQYGEVLNYVNDLRKHYETENKKKQPTEEEQESLFEGTTTNPKA